jgi:hypothetical protein
MTDNCTVDTQAISNYYNNKAGFSFIPFIGDTIGDSVMPKPPQDHSSDLSNVQAQLQSTTADVIQLLGKDYVELQDDFLNLLTLIKGDDAGTPGYVQATAQLIAEPLSEKITMLAIPLVALAIIVLVIIFAGI